ncbi:MAG: hypothetical protein IT343_18765 [Candidatus Melainabacteria bacterium]|jgi:hypothetical protein|nr:hypothetical protein [Candidatus Melainabacteria bacterium]
MQTEPLKKKNSQYVSWLLAFAVPFLLAALFGAWLGYGEFTEGIGKNYSIFGKAPEPFDALQAIAASSLMLGFPAGFVGIAFLAIFRFLQRVLSATKA